MKIKHDLEREEQNMLILRHPYLTVEQSCGHMDKSERNYKFFIGLFEERDRKFAKQITIADRLSHLRVTEAWD